MEPDTGVQGMKAHLRSFRAGCRTRRQPESMSRRQGRQRSSGDTMPNCLGEFREIRESNREQALRRMASRQARLEPLALSVSGHERMVNGWAAASEEKRIDFSAGIAWFGDILKYRGVVRRDWTPFGF